MYKPKTVNKMTLQKFKEESPFIRYSIWIRDTDFLQVYDEYKKEFIGKKYRYPARAYILCDELNHKHRDNK